VQPRGAPCRPRHISASVQALSVGDGLRVNALPRQTLGDLFLTYKLHCWPGCVAFNVVVSREEENWSVPRGTAAGDSAHGGSDEVAACLENWRLSF